MADDIKEQKVKELLVSVREFNATLGQLAEQDHIVDNFKAIVRTDLIRKYHKKWIGYSLALELYKILLESTQRFAFAKKGFVEKIKPLDPELAKRIYLLELPPKGELEVLEPIARMLNEDPTFAIAYINTHYPEIMEKLRTFNDKETAYELRRVMILLSGREVTELQKCIADAERWLTYRMTNRIDFFTLRLALYLKGGKDMVTGETYIGLASHFKDSTLAKQMMDIPQIKKLWTYKEEEQFFRWAESLIKRSLQEGGWQGFYEFYDNIKRGKNYARMVRERFGNPEFADFLERLPKAVHENPTVWEADLKKLSDKLENQNYQNVHVIEPAKQALITIFNARIEQLIAARRSALMDLKKLLTTRINELRNVKLTTQKNFVKILKKKRRKLLDGLTSLRNKLDNLSVMPDAKKVEFAHEYVAFIDTELDHSKTVSLLYNIYGRGISISNKMLKYTSSVRSEFDLLQPVATYGSYLDGLEDLGASYFERISLTPELLEGIIAKLRNFIKKLNFIITQNKKMLRFIYEQLNEFSLTFEDLKKMNLQFRKKAAEEKPLAA